MNRMHMTSRQVNKLHKKSIEKETHKVLCVINWHDADEKFKHVPAAVEHLCRSKKKGKV